MNKTPRTSITIPATSIADYMDMCMCPCMRTVGEKAGT